MNGGPANLVMWILAPLFGMIGLYLLWYLRRRRHMLAAFARNHSFPMRSGQGAELQETLDRCFSLNDEGMVRSFGQLSSLIEATPVWIFSVVELLDLDPYASAYSTNFTRIVALFDIANDYDEFFLLDKAMQASPALPGSQPPDQDLSTMAGQTVEDCHARHTLSVTLRRGYGLIYFEPLVTGGESLDDIESLYCIAGKLHGMLQGNA